MDKNASHLRVVRGDDDTACDALDIVNKLLSIQQDMIEIASILEKGEVYTRLPVKRCKQA